MPREITSIFGKKKVVLRETPRPVTPFGGLSVFVKFLEKIGYAEAVAKSVPIQLHSPNAIDPVETFTASASKPTREAEMGLQYRHLVAG